MALASPAAAHGQLEVTSRDASLRLGGQLDMHYVAPSPQSAPETFRIRRAWIVFHAGYTDFLSGQAVVDVAAGGAVVLDAFVRLNFDPRFRLSFGRFKRSFDIFVLNPIGDIPFLERRGGVPGYDACTGVGSVCSFGRLSEALLYSNRDTGIRIDGGLGSLGYSASYTNGTPGGILDDNDGKSFASRVTWDFGPRLQLGMNGTYKDFTNPSEETEYAVAWGPDLTVGTWRDGPHVQAAWLHGDNWRVYLPTAVRGGAGTFDAGQVQATWYFSTRAERVEGIEPLFRLSVADPHTGVQDDEGVLLTPGLAVYFRGRNRISLNVDYYRPAVGGDVYAVRVGTLLYY